MKQESLCIRDFLTVSQATKLLGVCAETLHSWDRAGKVVPVRHPVNGYRLYRHADVEALLEQLNEDRSVSKERTE
jgi:DNA-binding transcriptional MerR regulator